jgi:hypothetical protein
MGQARDKFGNLVGNPLNMTTGDDKTFRFSLAFYFTFLIVDVDV